MWFPFPLCVVIQESVLASISLCALKIFVDFYILILLNYLCRIGLEILFASLISCSTDSRKFQLIFLVYFYCLWEAVGARGCECRTTIRAFYLYSKNVLRLQSSEGKYKNKMLNT